MKVYVLNEEYWHYVDGSWTTMVDIYHNKEDADAEAQIRNDRDGGSDENYGTSFTVEEKELK